MLRTRACAGRGRRLGRTRRIPAARRRHQRQGGDAAAHGGRATATRCAPSCNCHRAFRRMRRRKRSRRRARRDSRTRCCSLAGAVAAASSPARAPDGFGRGGGAGEGRLAAAVKAGSAEAAVAAAAVPAGWAGGPRRSDGHRRACAAAARLQGNANYNLGGSMFDAAAYPLNGRVREEPDYVQQRYGSSLRRTAQRFPTSSTAAPERPSS